MQYINVVKIILHLISKNLTIYCYIYFSQIYPFISYIKIPAHSLNSTPH